jgi:hypothetical protein
MRCLRVCSAVYAIGDMPFGQAYRVDDDRNANINLLYLIANFRESRYKSASNCTFKP